MNSAHFHLVVNHFPIVGILIGFLTLIGGLLLRKSDVKITALGIFVFSAITSIFAFYSGEGAEEVVENLPGISETLIHSHEEYAETFFLVTLVLGAVALIGLIGEIKKSRFSKYLMILVLLAAMFDGLLAINVGISGGEIRHSEIRSNAKVIPLEVDDDD